MKHKHKINKGATKMSNWSNLTFVPTDATQNANIGLMSGTWTDPSSGAVFNYSETVNAASSSEQKQWALDAMAKAAQFLADEPTSVTPAQVVSAITPLLTN